KGKRWKPALIGGAIGLVVSLVIFGPESFEPTDSPRYVGVQVVSYHYGTRSQYFTLVNTNTSQSWVVGALKGPFDAEYRGPATLELRRGRWTGKDHLSLLRADSPRAHSD